MTEETVPEQGIGEQLREARIARGMEIFSVKQRLNLSERTLLAIENNDFASLPGASLARGYLRMYCRLLDISDVEILRQYDNLGRKDPELGAPKGLSGVANPNGPNMGLWTIIIMLSLAAMSGYWYLSGNRDDSLVDAIAIEQATDVQIPAETVLASDTTNAATVSAQQSASDEIANQIAAGVNLSTQMLEQIRLDDEQRRAGEQGPVDPLGIPEVPVTVGLTAASNGNTATSASGAATNNAAAPGSTASTAGVPDSTTNATADGGVAAVGSGDTAALQSAGVVTDVASEDGVALAPDGVGDNAAAAAIEAAEAEAAAAEAAAAADAAPFADIEAAKTGQQVVSLRSPEQCWVEISDSRGKRLAYTMLQPDVTMNLHGTAPFRVFLGKAPPVMVAFNGKPVSTPVPRGGRSTSRFVIELDGSAVKR